jgi:hypothetical protein
MPGPLIEGLQPQRIPQAALDGYHHTERFELREVYLSP